MNARSPAPPLESLGRLPIGVTATVRAVRCARPVARRLLEMGLLPGTEVRVVRMAPLGDPMEIALRGYALSIRHADAVDIDVERVAPAGPGAGR